MCAALAQYPWPGNVRELQNVIEHAAILAQYGRVRIESAAAWIIQTRSERGPDNPAASLLTEEERRDRDRANIVAALEVCGGKVSGPGGAANC